MTLSTPVMWVILPLIFAGTSAIFYKRRTLSILLSAVPALSLAALALLFPEDLLLDLGFITLEFEESLAFFGRQITLPHALLPLVALIYALTGLWVATSGWWNIPDTFSPISLTISSLLIAALGVQPFLYAALLIETAVLVSIPALSPLETKTTPGILRYLSLQTLALPLILLAGWLLAGVETLPPDSLLVSQTGMVLGLGFALLLGVFPFHSWLPMVFHTASPLVTSFLYFVMPTTIILFGLNFINQYTWLRESQNLYQILNTVGILMIALGGIWTAVQKDLKRAFGFSILTETGFSLLGVGLSNQGGLHWVLLLFPLRAIGFWLWGYSLTIMETYSDSLDLSGILGFARRYPILSSGLLISQLSTAGLPLLAVFPIKIKILSAALGTGTALGVWGFLGSTGLFIFSLRVLAYLVTEPEEHLNPTWKLSEKLSEMLPILLMITVLLMLGVFPHWLRGITKVLTAFSQLQ